MKITDVRAYPLSIPVRPMRPRSPWIDGLPRQIIVKIATDEGLTGIGECFAYGPTVSTAGIVEESLAPLLVGENPTEIERLVEKMERSMLLYGRRGLGVCAMSGVEIALWDLAGKARGVPVYELLGGLYAPRARAYASLMRYGSAAEVAAACRQYVEAGFGAIKLHQIDVESVRVAREAVGPAVELMLDVNCPWNPQEAIRMGRAFEPYHLAWFEEPVWPPEDYRGLAEVSAALDTPVAAGENEGLAQGFADIIAQRAVDILQPSMTKVGGLLHSKKICTLAAAANLTVVPHSFYFGPGLAATLHLIASSPGCRWLEFPTGELEVPLVTEPIVARDGYVGVPSGPGLGVALNEEVLARFPFGRAGKRPFILT
jgi:L-alanine-DL-glutamate epimerase-like enolase superfamily enzyme